MPDTDWYVYILRCADNTLYTGVATDVSARLATHNAGKGAKYTRGRLPVALLYQERAENRSAALRREHAIKKMRASDKRQLIATQDRNKPAPPTGRRAQQTTTAASSGNTSPK
jgi:predicted GIY-YIG superfamily endonuclease